MGLDLNVGLGRRRGKPVSVRLGLRRATDDRAAVIGVSATSAHRLVDAVGSVETVPAPKDSRTWVEQIMGLPIGVLSQVSMVARGELT